MPGQGRQTHFEIEDDDIEAAPMQAIDSDAQRMAIGDEKVGASKQLWRNGKAYFQERPKPVQYLLLGACAVLLWVLVSEEIIGNDSMDDQLA